MPHNLPYKQNADDDYRRCFGDVTDAEVKALLKMFGDIIFSDPTLIGSYLHLVRVKN